MWPDDGINLAQFFKSYPKSKQSNFCLKETFFKSKVKQYLGNLCIKKMLFRPFWNSQFCGHTDHQTWRSLLVNPICSCWALLLLLGEMRKLNSVGMLFQENTKKITYSDSRLLEEEKLSRLKLNFKGKTVQPIGLKFSVFITKGKPMAVLEKERAINYLPWRTKKLTRFLNKFTLIKAAKPLRLQLYLLL